MTKNKQPAALPTTVSQWVRWGAAQFDGSASAMLDARILLAHQTGWDEAQLIIQDQQALNPADCEAYQGLIARRAAGEPVSYIIGYKEFYGHRFGLHPGVLSPRPDSESLIEAIIARRAPDAVKSVLDLGTGSGCLLLSLLLAYGQARGVGVDRSDVALECAKANANQLGVAERASFLRGHWGDSVSHRFDVVVCNPPYIPIADASSLARDIVDYEDHGALFAGEDGLDAYRYILPQMKGLIAADGIIALELGAGQFGAVSAIAREVFEDSAHIRIEDLAGIERCLVIDTAIGVKQAD